MSKEFSMLIASRRLEKHLSREHYNLERMSENERVPQTLFETKVAHYNELVDTLNQLFGSLTNSKEQLFSRYELVTPDGGLVTTVPTPHDTVVDGMEFVESEIAVATETIVEQDIPEWQAEGYESYEEWALNKDVEGLEIQDDMSIGVSASVSQYRAGQALNEYQETSAQDITTYSPEDDVAVSVLPQEESMRPTEDLRYLNHTADGTRVDNNPIQITDVQTAVELDYEKARKGTDIDVARFIHSSDGVIVADDLIGDDISKLHATASN